jgi:cytochrome c oxidase assembly factor CtaG
MPLPDYLRAMLVGYLLTVAIETIVLLLGLSRRHPVRVRLLAGVWLTTCTYPIVWLVLPPLFANRWQYLLVAETFAPVAEGVLFWWAFVQPLPPNRPATSRDLVAITVANLCSFGLGEVIHALG